MILKPSDAPNTVIFVAYGAYDLSAAYDQIAVVMKELLHVSDAFEAAGRALRTIPEVKVNPEWQSFSECAVGFSDQRVLSWSIELSATRAITIARWEFELELEHWSHQCCLSAEAGFQGKYGPTATRVIPDVYVSTLAELSEARERMMHDLFRDLARDIEDATAADAEERRRFQEVRTS